MEIKGYRLAEIAGDGRTGRVYHAERIADSAKVAFRQVTPGLAKEPGVIEAVCELKKDTSELRNVVIVPIVDSFAVEKAICVVEPWVEGTTLTVRLADGAMSHEEVLTLGIEVCEALEELHDANLVHGDISAANVMLTSRGARLMGMGVAARTNRRRKATSRFTDPYDAPELKTAGVSPSSDLYGLAACLDVALKGEVDAAGGFQLTSGSSEEDPLRKAIDEGLAAHPGMRYPTARAFKRALMAVQMGPLPTRSAPAPEPEWDDEAVLRRAAQPEPPAPRFPPWAPKAAAIGAAVVLLLGVGTWLVGMLPDVPDGMVEIAAGSVGVGDAEGPFDERPGFGWRHPRFFLDRTEVPVSAYEECVADGVCAGVGTRLERRQEDASEPVVGVTWLQANSYCQSLGKRLPSENEWEAAARLFGGAWASGSRSPGCNDAWFGAWAEGPCGTPGQQAVPRSIPVDGGSPDVPLDLAGNVWEFTNSDYLPNRKQGTGDLAPPGASVLKVIKGGAFTTGSEELRSAARLGVEMDHWAADVGFRCAAEPEK